MMMGHVSGDQPVAADYQSRDVSADIAKEQIPTGSDAAMDPCCPSTCSVAVCTLDIVAVDRFIPDNVVAESMPEFIVAVMALPERPPRA